jgi:hypothetical protein
MGTSVAQIDATLYGHLLPDSEDYRRGLLDDYDVAVAVKRAKPPECDQARTRVLRDSHT